jgi:hypothetical protein
LSCMQLCYIWINKVTLLLTSQIQYTGWYWLYLPYFLCRTCVL